MSVVMQLKDSSCLYVQFHFRFIVMFISRLIDVFFVYRLQVL